MPTKILAIDDSKTMRLAIKITFAAEDAKVTAVSKGSEAVARAKQMGADVVLVDHQLAAGEPSGFDVVSALKSNSATSNIPVIMLIPAKGQIGDAEVSAAGADGYIGKPFDTQELIDKVGAALGRGASPGRSAAKAPAAKPPAAKPPAAKPPAARPPAAAKPPAAKPPAAKPPAAVAKRPAAKAPAAKAPAGKPPAAAKAPARAPSSAPRKPAAAKPAARPPATASTAPSSGDIPIAVPIPFTAAGSPTPGMLERIKAAAGNGGAAAGLDPAAVQALLQLSQEVVEQVVWEVVPDLAEEIIKQRASQL